MAPLPPGIAFWLAVLPHLLAPPIVIFGILNFLDEHSTAPALSAINLDLLQARWLRIALYVLATPTYLSLKNTWKNLKYRRAAWRNGAKMFPIHSGRLPFGLDILFNMIRALQTEYAGESLGRVVTDMGSKTVIIRALGEDRGDLLHL